MTQDTTPARGARAMREKQLREAIVECARRLGWLVYWTWNSRHSPKGMPDLCMVQPWRPGGTTRVIFAELKTGRRKLTPEQDDWLCALHQCPGVEVYIFREEDWLSGRVESILR